MNNAESGTALTFSTFLGSSIGSSIGLLPKTVVPIYHRQWRYCRAEPLIGSPGLFGIAHDALNRASGVLSLNKGGRMTRAELHIHFPGAAERLTAEFTVDPESHGLTPTKMAERYKHVLEDVSAVAVYSHFRWFDSEGRPIAPK
jgi:hypothetical protein